MQFQISGDLLLAAGGQVNARRIQPGQHHRLRHANAIGIGLRQPALGPGTGQPAAAEQRNTETRPFFIAKADNLDRLFQPTPLSMQTVHHLDRRQDAEHTVIAPGVAHRIKVRPQQDGGRPLLLSLVAPANIADAVLPDGHPGLGHPQRRPLVGRKMLRREINPGQDIRRFADRGQLIGAGHHPRRGLLHFRLLALCWTHWALSLR